MHYLEKKFVTLLVLNYLQRNMKYICFLCHFLTLRYSWNTSVWMTRDHSSHISNSMAMDDLAVQRARITTATMFWSCNPRIFHPQSRMTYHWDLWLWWKDPPLGIKIPGSRPHCSRWRFSKSYRKINMLRSTVPRKYFTLTPVRWLLMAICTSSKMLFYHLINLEQRVSYVKPYIYIYYSLCRSHHFVIFYLESRFIQDTVWRTR